jgi:choline dehydrogenase-like flavoprotein
MKIEDKDYIIVGSRPGGATVAKELFQRKKKLLILEWGDNNPLTGSFWLGAKLLLWSGRSLLFTSQMLGLVRGIAAGGSTVFYYATCFPVPFDKLKSHGVDITVEGETIVKESRNEAIEKQEEELTPSFRNAKTNLKI